VRWLKAALGVPGFASIDGSGDPSAELSVLVAVLDGFCSIYMTRRDFTAVSAQLSDPLIVAHLVRRLSKSPNITPATKAVKICRALLRFAQLVSNIGPQALAFAQNEGVRHVSSIMMLHRDTVSVLEAGCQLLATLGINEAVRPIVAAQKGIVTLVTVLRSSEGRQDQLVERSLVALQNFAADDACVAAFLNASGLGSVGTLLTSLSGPAGSPTQLTALLNLVSGLCRVVDVQTGLRTMGLIPLIVSVGVGSRPLEVLEAVCLAVMNVAKGNSDNQSVVVGGGGLTVLLTALNLHLNEASLVEAALAAVQTLVLNNSNASIVLYKSSPLETLAAVTRAHIRSSSILTRIVYIYWVFSSMGDEQRRLLDEQERVFEVLAMMRAFPDQQYLQGYACGFLLGMCNYPPALFKVQKNAFQAVQACAERFQGSFAGSNAQQILQCCFSGPAGGAAAAPRAASRR
ncbi:MAG TPA: hypothetical protein VJB16_04360, partial [archaeon]|nr:hypothetical protein [archaeon]